MNYTLHNIQKKILKKGMYEAHYINNNALIYITRSV